MVVKNNIQTNSVIQICKLLFVVVGFLFMTNYVHAATLNIVPSGGVHGVGEVFSLNVTASSTDQALNAIDGSITYPTGTLEVTSISKDNSILNLWVEEPSNSSGKISFSGVSVNPGFTGSNGKVLRINFKVKKTGSANVVFSAGSILANDGQGTNILAGFNNGYYSFGTEIAKPEPVPVSGSKVPVTQVVKNVPEENINYVPIPKAAFVLFPPEFIEGIKIFIQDLFFVILLLLLVSLLWFIVLRVSSAITILRLKLKNEVREVSSNVYETLRQKVDEDFFAGKYLGALTGYKKLQEQAPASKQAELSEKITQTNRFYIAEENFKKAQNLGNRGKWMEAGALIEESEILMDADFKYHDDAKRLYDNIEVHLKEISEKNNEQIVATKKKLAETLQLAEETKAQLIYQEGLLMSEKNKREQSDEEIKKQALLSEENNKKHSELWSEREISFEKELADVKEQMLIVKRKLMDTEHEMDETKSRLIYQDSLLSSEKAKREEAESIKMSLAQELSNKKEEVNSLQKKMTDIEHTAEEIKSQFTYQDGALMAEKSKREQAEEELHNLATSSRDKEMALRRELDSLLSSTMRESKDAQIAMEKELVDRQQALEKDFKDREKALRKELEISEGQARDSQKKLADALRHIEEIKTQLSHREGILNSEKEKIKILEEENKKYFAELRENKVALQKALDEAMVLKEKELSFKTAISNADEQNISMKNKLSDALHLVDEKERQFANSESLLAVEKTKREKMEKDNDKFALLIKEQALKIEKGDIEREAKYKDKEEAINKKLEEGKSIVAEAKKQLTETEKMLEETKNQLTKEQDLLKAEKIRTESLSAAISKLITPKTE